jgi:hypothetical protein
MASPTPGVLHLHRHVAAVACDGSVHLPDAGGGHRCACQSRNTFCGAAPSSARTTPSAASGAIGGASDCSADKRLLRLGRKRLHDEAEQLPELHQRALHVAQLASDVLRCADGERRCRAPRGAPVGDQPTCRDGPRSAPLRAVSRHTRSVRRRSARCSRPCRRLTPGSLRCGATGGGVLGQQLGRQLLTGDLVGPVRAGIEPGQRHLDVGEVALDAVEIERRRR